MRTGRPAKPTALKVLEGTRPDRIPKHEPKPRPLRPEKPSFLNDSAALLWDSLIDELEAVGVVTVVDQSALAGYCQAYEEAARLTRYLDEHGLTFTTPNGYVQQRPEVAIRNKAWDRVDKFACQLGIGAAHRTKIEVKRPSADENPLTEIIAEARAEAAARRRKG